MIRNKITKKVCSLYSKLENEYQVLGKGFCIDDEYLIVAADVINAAKTNNHRVIYAKLNEEYISFNLSSDWLFLTDSSLDIAIAKFNQVKKPKDKNKTEETFTETDFQNALKKVSRKVSHKKEKK